MPYVIMVTANPGSRHRVYADTLGVEVYMNKPIVTKDILGHMRDYFDAVGILEKGK